MVSDRALRIQKTARLHPIYEDGDTMIIDNVKVIKMFEAFHFPRNVIAFCSKGRMTGIYNDTPITLDERQVFISPPGSQMTNVMISPDFEFFCLAFTNTALQRYLREYISIWNQFAYVDKINILTMRTREGLAFVDIIQGLMRMLAEPTEDTEEEHYRHEMLMGTLHVVMIGLCNLMRRQEQAKVERPKQNVSYFNLFLDLLQRTEHKHQTVDYYASELCISTKYLTEICKKNSEKTANQWIREYVLADITHYLLNSNLSIKEIAAKVGFTNASFFGKYVKDAFGCTPLEYRNKK